MSISLYNLYTQQWRYNQYTSDISIRGEPTWLAIVETKVITKHTTSPAACQACFGDSRNLMLLRTRNSLLLVIASSQFSCFTVSFLTIVLAIRVLPGSGTTPGERERDEKTDSEGLHILDWGPSCSHLWIQSLISSSHRSYGCRSISYQAISGQSPSQWYASLRWVRWVGILDLLFPFVNKACHGYWLCILDASRRNLVPIWNGSWNMC